MYELNGDDGLLHPLASLAVLRLRHNGTQFGWPHVRRVALIRWLVAIWLVILGSAFCLFGLWWGALLFVPAGLNGWIALQMPRWKRALDADEDARLAGVAR